MRGVGCAACGPPRVGGCRARRPGAAGGEGVRVVRGPPGRGFGVGGTLLPRVGRGVWARPQGEAGFGGAEGGGEGPEAVLRDALATEADLLGLFVAARRSELDDAFFRHVGEEIEALEAPPPSRGKAARGARLFGLRRSLVQLCEAQDYMAGGLGLGEGQLGAGGAVEELGRAFDACDAEAVERFKAALQERVGGAVDLGFARVQQAAGEQDVEAEEGAFPPREAADKLEAMRGRVPSSFAPSNEERVLAVLVEIADDAARGEALERALEQVRREEGEGDDGAGVGPADAGVEEVSATPMRLLVECEKAVHRQELAHATGTPFEVIPFALPAPGASREDLTLVRLRWVRDALKRRAGFPVE